jgi:prephenate dehydratase
MPTYAYLGPSGTFTEQALRKIAGASDVLTPYANVTATLNAVREGKADKAFVPIENSIEGVVARTLDELAVGDPLVISAETTLPVSFALMVLPENEGKPITRIATHPHAEAQCRTYVATNLPGAEVIEAPSTAAAAKGLLEKNYDAAIASEIAAEKYGLKIVAKDIGDNQGAVTRFVVAEKPGALPAPTGADRTSLVTFIDSDRSGALLQILSEFAKHKVNLTFIQSRPTGRQLGHYHFIIDVEGHIADPKVAAAIEGVRTVCDEIRMLGSYPRVGRIHA